MRNTLVAKFGGTSVATPERILNAAQKIAEEVRRGHHVAVVVSAMAGQTNQLIDLARSFGPDSDRAEQDAIIACGEQVSAGLMAMALQSLGLKARSWQGWQARIQCDDLFGRAKIKGIDAPELQQAVRGGEVPVITGFQGISQDGRMVTLGRGGSDTSAVALASALDAQRCDIYTDVDGVYTADPRLVKGARKIGHVPYDVMLEMASRGSKVLHLRSVALAMRENVPVQVLSSLGSDIGSDLKGTMIGKAETMEETRVTGIAHSDAEVQITLSNLPDRPGVAADIFDRLSAASIPVDMIVQTASADGKATDMTFTIPADDLAAGEKALKPLECDISRDEHVAKISIIGIGLRSSAQIPAQSFAALAGAGVNINAIATSEICLSILIEQEKLEKAAQILHNTFQLQQ